jgi:hypothetical protein
MSLDDAINRARARQAEEAKARAADARRRAADVDVEKVVEKVVREYETSEVDSVVKDFLSRGGPNIPRHVRLPDDAGVLHVQPNGDWEITEQKPGYYPPWGESGKVTRLSRDLSRSVQPYPKGDKDIRSIVEEGVAEYILEYGNDA